MRQSTLPRIAAFAILATACPSAWADTTRELTNDLWTVTIDAASMQVTAQTGNGQSFLVSRGQGGLGRIDDLQSTSTNVRWTFSDRHIIAVFRLTSDRLLVEIRSSEKGQFTWPVMDLKADDQLIWPYWEGRYIPLDDEQWQSFLINQEWDTLEGLCMPFWGISRPQQTLTYIATNRFNNTIRFEKSDSGLRASFVHTFPPSRPEWTYGFAIELTNRSSPVESARVFRGWLIERGEFVPMSAKLERVPKTERLLGAIHAYLWGDAPLGSDDIKPKMWQPLCKQLIEQSRSAQPSPGRRIHELITTEQWKHVEAIAKLEWADKYAKAQACEGLCSVIERRDFYDEAAWKPIELTDAIKLLLARPRAELSSAELTHLNSMLLQAVFPNVFVPCDDWGNGASVKMLRQLHDSGLDRVRLCLPGWEGIEKRPRVAALADEMGYLFGPYDSFHSIHDPKLAGSEDSWTTAQFNQALYEAGPIVKENGQKRAGFKQRGYLLSPRAARPDVEKRVAANMKRVPYNHYFVDCDAFGQAFDDYSPLHPSTQEQDAAARADRLNWIRDTFSVVIGSEGGCSYFAPSIHIAEGMLTPVIGWGDPDMTKRESKFYLGAYYPPDGPAVFLKPVPLKDEYVHLHYDPRFCVPLNEIVFHDSFVSTHHWSAGSLKFINTQTTTALREMLYQCPPLYHLNAEQWSKDRDYILKHYAFFSPIHRQVGFKQMTSFEWLTPDRLVQRTTFDCNIELIANFGDRPFTTHGTTVPPKSAWAHGLSDSQDSLFSAN